MILDYCINGKDFIFIAGAYVIYDVMKGGKGYHRDDSAYIAYILYQ